MIGAESRLRFWVGPGVLALVLANCTWWSAKIGFDGAPDEKDHYKIVEFVAEHGRLPRYHEAGFGVGLMDSMTRERLSPGMDAGQSELLIQLHHRFEMRQSYLFTPQMPYLLAGWFCRALGGVGVRRARLFDATCIALAALCTFLAGIVLWNGRVVPAAIAGMLVGLWPQMTFVGAYVNDDAFAVLSVSVLILALAWAERGPRDVRRALALGGGLGLTACSKYYTMAALLLAGVWFVVRARRREHGFGRFAALCLAVAVLIAGPWLVRNTILYGDPTGRRFLAAQLQQLTASLPPEVRECTKLLPRPRPQSLSEAMGRGWFHTSLESFWARFGWMNERPHLAMYWTALGVVLAAFLWSLRGGRRPQDVPALFALPLFGLLLLLSLLNTYFVDFQPQGRYLLTCVPPLCLQLAAGAAAGPRRAGSILPWALLGFFAAQNLVARLLYLR